MSVISPKSTVSPPAVGVEVPTDQARLSGNMSTTSLVLSVLAFSGPIVTVAAYIAFAVGFAGEGTPLAWVVAAVVLLIFSVGYTTMTRHVPQPGAFYTYISLGLSKALGVGSAYLATVAYTLLACGVYVFAGTSFAKLATMFGVPETPWWIWTLATWTLVTSLAHFHVELSAKVLGVIMLLEIALVLLFNIFVLGKGGAEGLNVQPYVPSNFINGGTGMALLFAFSNFIGFEATALYRDEVRDPAKTIPRATYLSVLLIGVFYSVSCYSLIEAFGGSKAQGIAASEDAGGMFNTALDQYILPNFSFIALILVATSAIACLLSVHNVIARYLFNLGADRALPNYLSAVHPKHSSPYKASLTGGIVMAALLAPFAITKADPSLLVGAGSGIGTAGVLILMALVSFSVVTWFAKNGRNSETLWKTTIAPIIAGIALTSIVILAILRFDLLVGGAPGENLWMFGVILGVVVIGAGVALYYRSARPDIYEKLGRADVENCNL